MMGYSDKQEMVTAAGRKSRQLGLVGIPYHHKNRHKACRLRNQLYYICAMCAALMLILSPGIKAETDPGLDDVTITVIGLDEVPTRSLQVIELPEPDLGEIADINERISTDTPLATEIGFGDAVTGGGDASNQEPAGVGVAPPE